MSDGRNKNKSPNRLVCLSCSKSKIEKDFYLSNNEFHKNNGSRFPVCKPCVHLSIDINDMNSISNILQQLNRPFLFELWDRSKIESEKTGKELFGVYYKNLLLNYKDLTFKNSIERKVNTVNHVLESEFKKENFKFEVTQEMILRWGQNYEDDDYIKLEDFYNNMKRMNKIETPQEETYLKKLAAISLKMDKELEAGNAQQVKQLGDLFSKFMADSQFRAMDKSEVDKTGGIRSFGAIFAEVESEGHIPPWEEYRKLKGLTQDIVDKTIMHIENFTLRLNKIERMASPPSDTPKIENGDS